MAIKKRGVQQTAKDYALSKAKPAPKSAGLKNSLQISSEGLRSIDEVKDKGAYRQLPLDKIDLDPNQPRQDNKPTREEAIHLRDQYQAYKRFLEGDDKGFDPESFRVTHPERASIFIKFFQFAHNIEEHGLKHPINVYPDNIRNIIIVGERRFLAHLLIGAKTIDAIVRPHPIANQRAEEELKHLIGQVSENIQRDDFTLLDKVESAYRIYTLYKQINNKEPTVRQFQKLMHAGKTLSGELLKVVKSDDTLKQVRQGKLINLSEAYESAKTTTKVKPNVKKASAGRPTKVNLGKLEQPWIAKRIISKCAPGFDLQAVDWDDPKAVQAAWNAFIKSLIETTTV